MKKIITVIGGGSVNWMRGLMRDIYLLDEIEGGEIRLVDPNQLHTEAVASMLNTFNRIRGKEYRISIVESRKEALSGADFVLTTFSPGSMDAFWNDLELPIKYGIRQPVSMTVGVCGISAALRTVPVAYEIVEDMEEVCPGAWLLNVTNPMSAVTRAMNLAAKKTKVIGMCHEFHSLPGYLGPMLGLHRPDNVGILTYLYEWLPAQGFEYTVAGLNHFIWLTRATLKEEDVLPRIRDYSKTHWKVDSTGTDHGTQTTNVFGNNGEAKLALCRQFGYLPLAGDRHLVEFYPSLCNPRNGYAMKYGVNKTTVDLRRLMKVNEYQYILDVASEKIRVPWEKTGEEMTEIMRAIITGTSTTAIVNMPNVGQISNLPRDLVVETLAQVSEYGLEPKMSGELPGPIGSLCRLHVDVHELTVKAALEGNRKLLVEALSLDPSSGCSDFSEIPELADDLLKANREWLPRFFR
jgi:alpha-galactosidase/6-phospho-beta-glucosidase family protein